MFTADEMCQPLRTCEGGVHWYLVNDLLVWINKACDGPGAHKVAGIIKHLLDRTSPNIFIWSGMVILGLCFASPNITLPDQINMILVSALSNKCILLFPMLKYCILIGCSLTSKSDIMQDDVNCPISLS